MSVVTMGCNPGLPPAYPELWGVSNEVSGPLANAFTPGVRLRVGPGRGRQL